MATIVALAGLLLCLYLDSTKTDNDYCANPIVHAKPLRLSGNYVTPTAWGHGRSNSIRTGMTSHWAVLHRQRAAMLDDAAANPALDATYRDFARVKQC